MNQAHTRKKLERVRIYLPWEMMAIARTRPEGISRFIQHTITQYLNTTHDEGVGSCEPRHVKEQPEAVESQARPA